MDGGKTHFQERCQPPGFVLSRVTGREPRDFDYDLTDHSVAPHSIVLILISIVKSRIHRKPWRRSRSGHVGAVVESQYMSRSTDNPTNRQGQLYPDTIPYSQTQHHFPNQNTRHQQPTSNHQQIISAIEDICHDPSRVSLNTR